MTEKKKCDVYDHHWGYNLIEHDGIGHPTGEQICLECGISYRSCIDEQIRKSLSDNKKVKIIQFQFKPTESNIGIPFGYGFVGIVGLGDDGNLYSLQTIESFSEDEKAFETRNIWSRLDINP